MASVRAVHSRYRQGWATASEGEQDQCGCSYKTEKGQKWIKQLEGSEAKKD
jgi:hypothetical protein